MNYPNFDSTGLSLANRVPNEEHTITTLSAERHNYIVPRFAPFYEVGLTVIDKNTGEPLEPGEDYILTHRYQDAIDNINLNVYGSITLLDQSRSGQIVLVYQCLGGPFITDNNQAIQNGLNFLHELNTIDFSEIADVPTTFPPTPHNHVLNGIEGVTEILNQVTLMREAMENPNTELVLSDIKDFDERFVNPVIAGITGIANAIREKVASTNIPVEMSTPGRTPTSIGALNVGSWKDTPIVVQPQFNGTYKVDFDLNVVLTDPNADDIEVQARWTVNGLPVDRSYSNHTLQGFTVDDTIRLQVRLLNGSASDVAIAGDNHSSSLTISRIGN